jgi:hypothetical protein
MLVVCLLNKVIASCIVKYFSLEDIVKCSRLCKAMLVWRTDDPDWVRILCVESAIEEYFGKNFTPKLSMLLEFGKNNFIRLETDKCFGSCFGKQCTTRDLRYINFKISNQSFCEECFYKRHEKEFKYIPKNGKDYEHLWSIICEECKNLTLHKYWDYLHFQIITNVLCFVVSRQEECFLHIPSLRKYLQHFIHTTKKIKHI